MICRQQNHREGSIESILQKYRNLMQYWTTRFLKLLFHHHIPQGQVLYVPKFHNQLWNMLKHYFSLQLISNRYSQNQYDRLILPK
ncbi:hypothetical protein SAMN05216167_1285 [Spirosoma endophyticum]|uniref:Uncharacterized protein n=1 Tax=Spirosoma endophyticum TaxID=662367 RepID=A0A1I2FWD9_9BACT|nr:hypothetical protein SAMN05216167_1285 [Spirosoma endophyticum]